MDKKTHSAHPFLSGNSEVAAMMRDHDWYASPLGHPDTWPQALRTVVSLILNSKFPMFIAWGPDLGFLYNDSYVDVLGAKHPSALGRRFYDIWSEIWGDIYPLVERALAGEATYHENLPLLMDRNGYNEQTWFTFSYSPVHDESGEVAGMYCACVETTERVLAEAYRNEENERFRALFAQAPGFMATLRGPDHVFELTNQAYYQLVGHRDIIGKPVREALPEVAGQGFLDLLEQVYTSGEAYVGHAVLVKLQREPNGPLEERFVDFVYQPIRDARGVVTGIFAEGSDVTERKLTENALSTARARLEATLNAGEIGTWLFDLRNDKVYADANFARLYGISEADANGGPSAAYFKSLHPDDVAKAHANVERSIATGQPYQDFYRVCMQNGKYRFIHARGKVEYDSAGQPVMLPGVVLDITEQKQIEEALQKREERYRALFNSVEQGFCIAELIYDAQGCVIDHRYLEVNPAFETQSGLHNVTGKTVRELVPDYQQRWSDQYAHVLETGEPAHAVYHVASLGKWFDVSVSRLGNPANRQIAILFKDITEKQRHEEALRQLAADLSQANQRQSEFLATLAHELRNPLAPIRTGLDLLRVSSGNPVATSRIHEKMERQVDHLVHLVNDLLDLARISTGKIEIRKTRVLLKDVVLHAVETTLPAIEAKHHNFSVRIPDEPIWIDADANRLAQVIGNILTNAAKYTPDGGEIELSAHPEGRQAVVTVTDNGIGIPVDLLPHIFDIFTQAGHGLDHAQGGLGIGLSLVKRLTEMHGGTVIATSAGPGQGSQFTLRLPVAQSDPMASKNVEERNAGNPGQVRRGLRILIVDDNQDAAELLQQLLEMSGHSVRIAANGIAGLDMARQFLPELALLDIGLPGMNGYELAQALRRLPGLQSTRLVAVTGWGTKDDRERSRAAGFDRHLTKPIDIHGLNRLVSELVSSRKSEPGR